MKARSLGLFLIATIATASMTSAQSRGDRQSTRSHVQLQRALGAVATAIQSTTTPPARTEDKDQGDDHANAGAILRVCSKTTPAARRAAICPVGVSPD